MFWRVLNRFDFRVRRLRDRSSILWDRGDVVVISFRVWASKFETRMRIESRNSYAFIYLLL